MPPKRQLAAIMFTDIVGYTALMGKDEERAFDLLKKNREIQKPIVEQYNGRWIKEMGDGVLLCFNTVSDAVSAAFSIQEACTATHDLRLRIGIHLGEVVFENDDVYGDGVNLASRLQVIAPPGGIYISESVERNVENKRGMKIVFVKEEKLKNVNKTERIYQLLPDLSGEGSQVISEKAFLTGKRNVRYLFLAVLLLLLVFAGFSMYGLFRKSNTSASHDTKSIAVLPFKLIGDDAEGKYFAEGVVDALINHLHGIENLNVRSRTSVEKYASSTKTIPEIANELDVQYILEGSAQKYKDNIRIIVQLINPESDDHLWNQEYNRKYEDIFTVQSEIALNIVSQLNVRLAGTQRRHLHEQPTTSTEAWDLYLRGREYLRTWWKFHEQNDIVFATDFFRRAISKDSTFALAYTALADAIKTRLDLEERKELQDSVFVLIQKSIKLNPDLPQNYQSLSELYAFNLEDFDTGLRMIDKAIAFDPENQSFLISKGRILAMQNKHLEALTLYNTAMQKEPTEYYPWLLHSIGWSYMCIGEFTFAETFTLKSLDLMPDQLLFLQTLARTQMIKGAYEELMQTTNRSLSIRKDNLGLRDQAKAYLLLKDYSNAEQSYAAFFALPPEKYFFSMHEKTSYAFVLQKLGKSKEAQQQITEAKQWIEKNLPDPNYDLAKVCALIGQKEQALEYLKNWTPSWGLQLWIERDPAFESLRNEPGFQELVQFFKSDIQQLQKQAREKIAKGEFPTPEMIRQ